MGSSPVTVAEFKEFVTKTGYKTSVQVHDLKNSAFSELGFRIAKLIR